MIKLLNIPRRSLQIDADFAFRMRREPWPRFYQSQDRLLASDKLSAANKQRLQNWIAGNPASECVPVGGAA